MDAKILVSDHAAPSLLRWLKDDLGPSVPMGSAETSETGEMGSDALDLINVVISNGIALASLIVSILAWRETRPKKESIKIEHGDTVIVIERSE